jgi:hypothetical protein
MVKSSPGGDTGEGGIFSAEVRGSNIFVSVPSVVFVPSIPCLLASVFIRACLAVVSERRQVHPPVLRSFLPSVVILRRTGGEGGWFINLFFKKITFSGFSLGNCEKIAVVANANFFHFFVKMPPCLPIKHRL